MSEINTNAVETQSVACPEFRPFEQPYLNDPLPFLAQARQEYPIFFSPIFRMWVVTRYDDVMTVLKNPLLYSSQKALIRPSTFTPEVSELLQDTLFDPTFGGLVASDPPQHTRMRRPLTTAFSARRIAQLEPDVRKIAIQLIEAFSGHEVIDFVPSFALPLPIRVICRLIGVPDCDCEQIRQWGDDLAALVNHASSPEEQLKHARGCQALYAYMGQLLEQRRRAPQDDLATALLRATGQEQTRLDTRELRELLVALVVAGFVTTIHFLSACLLLLLSRPGAWEQLDYDVEHLDRVVEEALRLVPPIMGIFRATTQEVQLGGVTLPAGSVIYVVMASANYDEQHFAHPEAIDLYRSEGSRHMTFGYGIHFCIGAPLARLEARVALSVLRQRFPQLRLAPGQTFSYTPGLLTRGLEHLLIDLNAPVASSKHK